MIRRAFITGSRVYGEPKKKSDIDLVILTDALSVELLIKMADEELRPNSGYDPKDARCLRFGNLNLLCCLNPKHFDVWKEGTEILKTRAAKRGTPVLREEAVSFLSWFRNKKGIKEY